MCTLTWWAGKSGYEVFFNRDEKKERPVADPPSEGERNGVSYLAPRDPVAGGSWLLANERGATLGILNWYAREVRSAAATAFVSRGQLLLGLADCSDQKSIDEKLNAIDPGRYRPFRVVGFFPTDNGCDVFRWNWSGEGKIERIEKPRMPICSSSFERENVIHARLAAWNAQKDRDPEEHWRFHHGTDPAGKHSACSVRMNRPDAQTWSISRITVDRRQIKFLYEAESPNLDAAPEVFRSVMDRKVPN